jgi:hypothetical protein
MSNLVEFFFGCAFAFLERIRRNDFLDRRLDVCCLDGCNWCYLLLLLKQNFGLATVILVEDVQSNL